VPAITSSVHLIAAGLAVGGKVLVTGVCEHDKNTAAELGTTKDPISDPSQNEPDLTWLIEVEPDAQLSYVMDH